jgi:hypothetical protein
MDRPRYYTDVSTPGTIYDQRDGMPALVVMPQSGKWTDERQAMLEMVLKVINQPVGADTKSVG